jgi:small subunit ribosomal protein S20
VATHASAEKRNRQNIKRRERNRAIRATIRTSVKKVISLNSAGEKDAADAEFKKATTLLDRAVTNGVLHKNNAARRISRLQKQVSSAQ